jgi:hypothetical protein
MSLGFNTMRAPRYTNLPGSAGVATIYSAPRRRKSPKPLPVVPPRPPPKEELAHCVYATATEDLFDGEFLVAKAGSRVLAVHPTKEDGDTVKMRIKTVHPVTAQLSYHWVTAYERATSRRPLSDFSLLP